MKNGTRYLLLLLLIWSCRKDTPPIPDENAQIVSGHGKVYILNEGNFQFGNAKLSVYDPQNNEVVVDSTDRACSGAHDRG